MPAQAIIPRIQELLTSFRSAGFPVYHTREGNLLRFLCSLACDADVPGHRPDLSTLSSRETYRSRNNPSGLGIGSPGPLGRLLIRGEMGHDTIDELYPIPGEPVIDKPGKGAFAYTDFELLLRNKGVKNLVITGVTTDVCVTTIMREANDRSFDCVVVEDATATSDDSLHLNTLDSIKVEGGIFGTVGRTDDLVHAVENFKALTVKKLAPQMTESV